MRSIILLLTLLLLGAPTLAAPARELKFSADKLDYDESKKIVRLIGQVRIESEDTVMTAPYAEFNTETQVGDFEGGVKIVGRGTTATGNRMRVWYGDQRGLLKGNVRVVSESAPGSDQTTPTVLLTDELDYFWEKGEGYARGRVKVRQGDRRGYSDRATYDQKRQIVVMQDNVRFERGGEDWLTASQATMNLVDETVVAQGRVVARTRLESTKEDPEQQQEAKPLPRPDVVEPDYDLKPIDSSKPILLPGLDD